MNPSLASHLTSLVEVSKLAELNEPAGGYDWAWQKEAKVLQEKTEAAGGVGGVKEDSDSKAALKLSMDNILMVSPTQKKRGSHTLCSAVHKKQVYFSLSVVIDCFFSN